MMSTPQDDADEADVAEQKTSVAEDEEDIDVRGRDDVDEGDLLEQATPVPEDDEDYRP